MTAAAEFGAAYAAAGFRPLALKPNSKEPAWAAWQTTAPTTPEAARQRLGHHRGNIGITFGPDLFALDLDRKGGKDGIATIEAIAAPHGGLPPTLTQRTPSGSEHRIFRKPPGVILKNRANGIAPGIDVRAAGGQIGCEPSELDGKPWQWIDWEPLTGEVPEIADAPQWLLDLLAADNQQGKKQPTAPGAKLHEGGRNDALFRDAAAMRRRGFDDEAIRAALTVRNRNDCAPPLPDAEVAKIAESAARYAPEPESARTKQNVILTPAPPGISAAEWEHARSHPDEIVDRFLFADVGLLVAPGGTGKTSLLLHMAACVALGLPLYDRQVLRPGVVVLVTAEDSREILVARLRSIARAMDLSAEQIEMLRDRVRILDVSGSGAKLTAIADDAVVPSPWVDLLADELADLRPSWLAFDPAVSFGIGEARVNDGEQGLIDAGRRLRNRLNCAITFVHHTGKQVARDKVVDQYAGRGGSALADGARMVSVLATLDADEFLRETGQQLADGESAIRLATPKLSYVPPDERRDILIRRDGFRFTAVPPVASGDATLRDALADMLHRFLVSELGEGRKHSKASLEAERQDVKRSDLRRALGWLEATGRIEHRRTGASKGAKTYLHPVVGSPEAAGEASPEMDEGGAND